MMATPALAFIIALLAAFSSSPAAAADIAAPSPPIGCRKELLKMSSCVPYLATVPSAAPTFPSAACCQAFSASAFGDAGVGVGLSCLCYLAQNPSMLGFPVNASRIPGLVTFCTRNGDTASFTWFCEVQVKALPPYVKPAAPTAVRPDTPAINDTDHGKEKIPANPEHSGKIMVNIQALALFLIMSLIFFTEARNPLTWGRAMLLLGVLFLMLNLLSLSVSVNH